MTDTNSVFSIERVERSPPRGRAPLVSSGRGGAGNIRPVSESSESRNVGGPDDFSDTRGREVPTKSIHEMVQVTHSGRGGAGNIRSPSRDSHAEEKARAEEHARVVQHLAQGQTEPHSSGRGGAGNITRSLSRGHAVSLDAGPPSPRSSSVSGVGKGGYGNISHGASSPTRTNFGYDLAAERAALGHAASPSAQTPPAGFDLKAEQASLHSHASTRA